MHFTSMGWRWSRNTIETGYRFIVAQVGMIKVVGQVRNVELRESSIAYQVYRNITLVFHTVHSGTLLLFLLERSRTGQEELRLFSGTRMIMCQGLCSWISWSAWLGS